MTIAPLLFGILALVVPVVLLSLIPDLVRLLCSKRNKWKGPA